MIFKRLFFLTYLISFQFLFSIAYAKTQTIAPFFKNTNNAYALLIGVSEYEKDNNGWSWDSLESIPGELDKVEKVLTKYGFQVERPERDNPKALSAAVIRRHVADFIARKGRKKANRLLIYFSGHGYTWVDGAITKGYILPSDTPRSKAKKYTEDPGYEFRTKAIKMDVVRGWSQDIDARHVLFVFDSCFSGTIGFTKTEPLINDPTDYTRFFISAGKAGQEVPAASYFTNAFVEGLEQNKADDDNNGLITASELGGYLERIVPNRTAFLGEKLKQTPVKGTINSNPVSKGEFSFYRPPNQDCQNILQKIEPLVDQGKYHEVEEQIKRLNEKACAYDQTIYEDQVKLARDTAKFNRKLRRCEQTLQRDQLRINSFKSFDCFNDLRIDYGEKPKITQGLKRVRQMYVQRIETAIAAKNKSQAENHLFNLEVNFKNAPKINDYHQQIARLEKTPPSLVIPASRKADRVEQQATKHQAEKQLAAERAAKQREMQRRVQARQEKLTNQLSQCNKLYKKQYYTSREDGQSGATAYSCYKGLLSEEANNEIAAKRLGEIELKYQRWFSRALQEKQWSKAQSYLETLTQYFPEPEKRLKEEEQLRAGIKDAEALREAREAHQRGTKASEQRQRIEEGITKMELIRVKAGRFMMGSPDGRSGTKKEAGWDRDETPHKVTLTHDYYLGKYEVTQGEWKKIMGSNPSYFKNCGADCPVEQVSWGEIQTFINRLNKKSKARGEGGGYRLPTEAEWEYAARAGSSEAFSFGANISPSQVNYDGNLPYNGGSKGEYRNKTVAVGSLPANAWGFHEMHGNVWEWVSDKYVAYPSSPVTDPDVQSGGSLRVFRGGSWYGSAGYCRSANRIGYKPDGGDSDLGFRLARSF